MRLEDLDVTPDDAADHIAAGHGLAELVPFTPAADEWPDPMPLGMSTASLPPFPVAALGKHLAPYVSALSETMQTPTDLPGSIVLGVGAATVGGRVQVQCPTHVEPTNLYVVPVLAPGSRKSGVVQACRRPLTAAEAQLRAELGDEVNDSQTRYEVWVKIAEQSKAKAAKSGDPTDLDDAQWNVRRAEEYRQQVKTWPRLTTSDATPEELVGLLARHGGRIAAISAEAGMFTSLTGRYTKAANLDAILQAHAGDAITVDRRSREPEHIESPALTVICSIQPFALVEMVERPDFAGRGLLARVLWSIPADNAGWRKVRGVPPVPDDIEADYVTTLRDLAIAAGKLAEPLTVKMTDAATEVYYEFAEQVETSLRLTGRLGQQRLTREWGSKLHGVAARIAGVLHAVRNGLVDLVDEETMRDAVAIARYYAAHAVVALTERDDEGASHSRMLLSWLAERKLTAFTRREIARRGPNQLRRPEVLTDVIADLVDRGWLRDDAGKGWLVHPRSADLLAEAATPATPATTAGQGTYEPVAADCDTCDSDGLWDVAS